MAIGFSDSFDFSQVIGWELYQVTIDKYHIMFWFESERGLLNVADRFSFRSADGTVNFTYDIYGNDKFLNVDRILRVKVSEVRIITKDQLELVFENGDALSVYDNPDFRSWWFLGGREFTRQDGWSGFTFQIGDREIEDLTKAELRDRRA
jgi:hypothetical protein